MIWIFYSLLYALFSAINGVGIKLVGRYFGHLTLGLSIGLICSFFIIIYMIINNQISDLKKINKIEIIIGLVFGLFNYFLLKALLAYHNPGVILSILRTQVILTMIFGIFFLKTKIDFTKIILLIFFLIGVILTLFEINFKKKRKDNKFIESEDEQNIHYYINNGNKERIKNLKIKLSKSKDNQIDKNNYSWIIYIFLAIILYSIVDLISKYKSNSVFMSTHNLCLMIGYSFVFLIIIIIKKLFFRNIKTISENTIEEEILVNNSKFKYLKSYIFLLLLSIVFLLTILNLTLGISNTNTPSLVKAIGCCSILIAIILSLFVFKEKPKINQIIGSFIIIISSLSLAFF